MKNSPELHLSHINSSLLAVLPFLAILGFGFLGTSGNAFAENPYDSAITANIIEDSWNRKAQAMIKIFTAEDDRQVLLVENFITNADRPLAVYFASEHGLEKQVRLGEIDPNKKSQFYTIPNEINFSEYNTILIVEEHYSIIYGKAMIF